MTRSGGLHVTEGAEYGIPALYLENERLKVTVLTGKGCEIYRIEGKKSGTDILCKTRDGLRPYEGRDLRKRRLTWYSELYAGGWQDVLPHRGTYGDVEITPDMFGIAATLPWECESIERTDRAVRVRCAADLPVVPIRVEKTLELRAGDPALRIRETVRNVGTSELRFTWTQHPAFGGAFLDESVEIELPCAKAFKVREYSESDRTDEADFEAPVERVALRDGRTYNLLRVPARSGAADELFVTLKHVSRPEYTLTNRRTNMSVRVRWDLETFPHLRYYYKNGPELYTIAIEPGNDYFAGWEDSLAAGAYARLEPNGELSTWLTCEVIE